MNTSLVLFKSVLKKKFILYISTIHNNGEIKEEIIKMTRDKFLEYVEEIDCKVILVDKYPTREEWQNGVFYVVKSGKGIYYKEKIGKIISFK